MSTTVNRPAKRHEGHNVKRFREILGVKQENAKIEDLRDSRNLS